MVARFRPQNRREIEAGGQPIVNFDSDDTFTLDVGHGLGGLEAAANNTRSLKMPKGLLLSIAFLI